MPSRKLTEAEIAQADAILARVKADITAAAQGDPVLLFALRRRTFIRLMYWERSTPAERNKLKAAKWKAQDGRCAKCGEQVPQKGSELDRTDPVLGYTADNTRLLCHTCHVADHKAKGYV